MCQEPGNEWLRTTEEGRPWSESRGRPGDKGTSWCMGLWRVTITVLKSRGCFPPGAILMCSVACSTICRWPRTGTPVYSVTQLYHHYTFPPSHYFPNSDVEGGAKSYHISCLQEAPWNAWNRTVIRVTQDTWQKRRWLFFSVTWAHPEVLIDSKG